MKPLILIAIDFTLFMLQFLLNFIIKYFRINQYFSSVIIYGITKNYLQFMSKHSKDIEILNE